MRARTGYFRRRKANSYLETLATRGVRATQAHAAESHIDVGRQHCLAQDRPSKVWSIPRFRSAHSLKATFSLVSNHLFDTTTAAPSQVLRLWRRSLVLAIID